MSTRCNDAPEIPPGSPVELPPGQLPPDIPPGEPVENPPPLPEIPPDAPIEIPPAPGATAISM